MARIRNMPGRIRRRGTSASVENLVPEISLEPRVELVEHAGIRWINIEKPGPAEDAWLRENFEFHELDLEDVRSRNQRPKIDEYDDYLFIILHLAVFDKRVGRLNAAELDMFVGPDFVLTLPNGELKPIEYLFERCKSHEETREQRMGQGTGYLLYTIVDDAFASFFPMLRKIGLKLDSIEEAIRTMKEHAVRRLPVIDGHDLVGIVSQGDIAKQVSDEATGDLIEAISTAS